MLAKPKNLIDSPGAYLFKDKRGVVLYVGRAVNLKRRVAQYFGGGVDPRIAEMVGLAKKLEIRTTPTLLEAIILEANLIKKHWPKYNIREKDDKSFVYLIIPKRVAYPQPIIIRGRGLSENQSPITNHYIFGPFQGIRELQELLKIIRRAIPFSFSRCKPLSGRPCFDYQIGLCPGVCVGAITKQEYQKHIRNLVLLLSGKKQTVLKNLKKQNPDKAGILQHLQDLALLKREKQFAISNLPLARIEAYDVTHFGGKGTYGAMAVAAGGELDTSQYRLFKIRTAPANDDLRALQEMLARRLKHKEWPYPDLIVVDGGIPQVRHYSRVLKNLRIVIPVMGISKLGKDRFVFSARFPQKTMAAAKQNRQLLLRLRDEAHRFANRARKYGARVKLQQWGMV